jgi:hypothetical protein
MQRHCLLGVVVLLAGVGAPAYGQEGIKLQWKFKEGSKFYVEEAQTSKLNVTVLGMQVKEEGKTTIVTSYHIKKVGTDSIVMVQKFEEVDHKSQGELGGATEKLYGKLKGATFTITMTPEGKVTKFEGYKEWAKKVADDDNELAKLVGLLFSEGFFKATPEQAFGMTPKAAVKEGDTWKQEGVMPVGGIGDFKLVSDYTYKGKGEGGEKIGFKQSLTYTPPKGGDFGGLFKIVKGSLKSEGGKGQMIFDADKGRMVSSKSSMLIRGSLTVDVSGQNVELLISLDQQTAVRVLDQNPVKD